MAEEILKAHTIPEIREIVINLEKEALSKKTELQHMVGSKYHDFIQSADLIADMQQRVSDMEVKLGEFWKSSQSLVDKTYDLLNRTNETPSTDKIVNIKSLRVNTSSIWEALERCDVYEATRLIAIANAASSAESSTSKIFSYFQGFQSGNLRSAIKASERELFLATELKQTVMDDARLLLLDPSSTPAERACHLTSMSILGGLTRTQLMTEFLASADTLLEDALVGARQFGGAGNKDRHDPQSSVLISAAHCLQRIILDAHVLFFRALSLTAPANDRAPDSKLASSHGVGSRPLNASNQANLAPVIGFINGGCGILSLFQVFFIRDLSRVIALGRDDNKIVTRAQLFPVVPFDFAAFARGPQSNPMVAECRQMFDAWLSEAVKQVSRASTSVLSTMNSATDVARLQQRVWESATQVYGATGHQGSLGKGEYGDVNNSQRDHTSKRALVLVADESVLQFDPLHLYQHHAHHGSKIVSSYTQADWSCACEELLVSSRKQKLLSSLSMSGSDQLLESQSGGQLSTLLWSLVFMSPFMKQVERLLRRSCQDVLGRMRNDILHALSEDGVILDSESLSVQSALTSSTPHIYGKGKSIVPHSTVHASTLPLAPMVSSKVPSYLGSLPPGTEPIGFLSANSSSSSGARSSARVCQRAEYIRSLLEDEIAVLLTDVILPVQDGDPNSAAGLSRALYVQCAQLLAHILIILRAATTSIADALREVLGNTHDKARSNLEPAPLMHALVLLARICWLIKIRGRFLEEALTPLTFTNTSKLGASSINIESFDGRFKSLTHQQLELNSEDQLISACEIADTNGDGILTYPEAVEALQALSILDSEDSIDNEVFFLSPTLTPTVSFAELALLCAEYLTVPACRAVDRVQSCASAILSNAHTEWVDSVVLESTVRLNAGLRFELGWALPSPSGQAQTEASPETMAAPSAFSKPLAAVSSASFKLRWKSINIEVDDSDSGSMIQEQMVIPYAPTSALYDYLFGCNHNLFFTMLSADTVQCLAACFSINDNATESSVSPISADGRLVDYVTGLMRVQSLSSVVATYEKLLSNVQTSLSETEVEEVSLQVVFDLLLCMHACQETISTVNADSDVGKNLSEVLNKVKILLEHWEALVDAVNYQLFKSRLLTAATEHVRNVGLLLPLFFPVAANLSSSSTTASSTHNSASKAHSLQLQQNSYLSKSCSRFGLLPLPVSTQSILTGSMPRSQGSIRTQAQGAIPFATPDGKGARGAASKGTSLNSESAATNATPVMSAPSSLRMGIMSGIGNLLGAVGSTDK